MLIKWRANSTGLVSQSEMNYNFRTSLLTNSSSFFTLAKFLGHLVTFACGVNKLRSTLVVFIHPESLKPWIWPNTAFTISLLTVIIMPQVLKCWEPSNPAGLDSYWLYKVGLIPLLFLGDCPVREKLLSLPVRISLKFFWVHADVTFRST